MYREYTPPQPCGDEYQKSKEVKPRPASPPLAKHAGAAICAVHTNDVHFVL
jgi:hypothetical protein